MKDYLIRGTAMDGKVRAFAVKTTHLTEEMRQRHGTTPVATAALGRTAAASLMMGAMLKGEEKLTVQVKGGGPIGQIVVDANAKGEVRGYVSEPLVDLPLNAVDKLDVAGAVGTDGFLYIIKDLGLKEPYRGSIPIVSGELAEDFTYYFAKSEQTPSAVALGVLVDVDYTVRASGGWIIQLLPGLSDQTITEIEQQLAGVPPISTLLDQGKSLEDILADILPSVQILEKSPVYFKCFCSRERVKNTLISLGRDELKSLIEEEGAEIVCHFCNEKYQFNVEELKELLNTLNK
ncbi:33 kDa chaperonin [Paenibacillus larvae subsp. larvae]|uniref:33 kDa chaperonin n=1 Tax=Paenibacillus larvae subsp. larvae TaxID=147375 RepID=A0A2L1TUX5_9BACL|nr:Hsp33 family molecular chaperone HslO [Paenibacillus larvae]AQT85197.1 Hsp33 family molecular chaperone [Paenibacillus larvae subsp. pulvifaciens]AQZ47199.1 Hsp33 family molecular chaperone [Paenibacillus larvae subsp. pulvifaciens]AVF24493.1 33 kDa chaperonin [Paenibacillus larvae subsp. larvae]AVF29254.1 33 kDa chaperonin [Paenibacillus larvae subsp. larvae]MBH0344169.1 heat shock protein Hsp33 [Paenibacillus larvae]